MLDIRLHIDAPTLITIGFGRISTEPLNQNHNLISELLTIQAKVSPQDCNLSVSLQLEIKIKSILVHHFNDSPRDHTLVFKYRIIINQDMLYHKWIKSRFILL